MPYRSSLYGFSCMNGMQYNDLEEYKTESGFERETRCIDDYDALLVVATGMIA